MRKPLFAQSLSPFVGGVCGVTSNNYASIFPGDELSNGMCIRFHGVTTTNGDCRHGLAFGKGMQACELWLNGSVVLINENPHSYA